MRRAASVLNLLHGPVSEGLVGAAQRVVVGVTARVLNLKPEVDFTFLMDHRAYLCLPL